MDNPRATRIGLVLGAGGVLGGAWMAGALHAIADRTRFYPRHAEYIVGTSAGSVLAALGAAGVPPWLLIPESSANIYHGLIDADGNLAHTSRTAKPAARLGVTGAVGFWAARLDRRHAGPDRAAAGRFHLDGPDQGDDPLGRPQGRVGATPELLDRGL